MVTFDKDGARYERCTIFRPISERPAEGQTFYFGNAPWTIINFRQAETTWGPLWFVTLERPVDTHRPEEEDAE